MEGFMDVIAAYRAGIENAVASMGTALSKEHVDHLKRFTKKIVLSYDGDKAGQAATAKALEELKTFQWRLFEYLMLWTQMSIYKRILLKTWLTF